MIGPLERDASTLILSAAPARHIEQINRAPWALPIFCLSQVKR
jgi:hypothetical protein